MDKLKAVALSLLQSLIATPSFSKDESATAAIIADFLSKNGITTQRVKNNVIASNRFFNEALPTILLNSHHDTVKPNSGYSIDPFVPQVCDGKLYGLGSNDAGGCLVALLACFLHYYRQEGMPYNLLFIASAEEEISGRDGIELALTAAGNIDFAIVGEPTLMQMAIAERGLIVLDVQTEGRAGHAARNEGENALYKAIDDINKLRSYNFSRVSSLLGPCSMNVTVAETANRQHNVVPASCNYVIDVRVNELYTFEEILEAIQQNISGKVLPRSLRLRSSIISLEHPLVARGLGLGLPYYGSPTTSDKALMPFPALKLGPGDSARSHTADEYIFIEELYNGIDVYINLLKHFLEN